MRNYYPRAVGDKIREVIEGVPDLLAALRTGAGTDAALRLLKRVQAPDSSAAFGEQVAVAAEAPPTQSAVR